MKTMLIIDDSPMIIKEIKQLAEEYGYSVVGGSKTGEDGLEKYKEFQPDVVTLDVIMPGMDGIETAQKILEINPKAKIVMVTSLCDFDTLEEIQNLGLSQLVSKPIDPEELMRAVETILKEY